MKHALLGQRGCDGCGDEMPELDHVPVLRTGYLMCNDCFDSGVPLSSLHAVTSRLREIVTSSSVARPMSALTRAGRVRG